jgi:hypothetical protein
MGAMRDSEAGVRKASREETAAGVRAGGVAGYGDLAPTFDLIVRSRIGKAAERAVQRWCRSLRGADGRVMSRRVICVLGWQAGLMVAIG